MKLRNLAHSPPCLAAARPSRRRVRPGQGAILPGAVVPHRPLRAQRHAMGQRLASTTSSWSTRARRHQRREAHVRGMRNRLRHRPRRGVLRAPEGQARRRRAVPAAVHRHHVRADREGARRQDSAGDRWATAAARGADGRVFKWNFPLRAATGPAADVHPAAHRQEGRRPGQAQGQEDRPGLSRLARTARSRSRCCRSARRCTAST